LNYEKNRERERENYMIKPLSADGFKKIFTFTQEIEYFKKELELM